MRPGAYNTEDAWSLSLWSWMIYFLLASVSLSMKCEKKILSRWMFLKTLTNPMKHYIIANYYGRMRIQNKRKSFASDSKLKGQRMNICHCPLPTHHEISKWESLLYLINTDLWVYTVVQSLHSGQWHFIHDSQWIPNEGPDLCWNLHWSFFRTSKQRVYFLCVLH